MDLPRSRRERRLDFWLVISGVVLVCALFATGIAALADAGPFQDEPRDCADYSFDQDEWSADSHRLGEGTALSKCRVLIGLSRQQVRSMLGAEKFSDDRHLYYDIDSDFDGTALVVTFDDSGRVERSDIETG